MKTAEPSGFAGHSAERVRQQLERMLASRLLAKNSRSGQLLSFVVEEALSGRAASLKETSLATEVFHRKATFDPRVDSIVRVEAHQLRKRLREYYASQGASDDLVIEVPVGSYVPTIRKRTAPGDVGKKRSGRWIFVGLTATGLGLVLLALRLLGPDETRQSVAVLPFQDFGNGSNDLLCLSIAEDVTTQLARIPNLLVTSRTNAFEAYAKSKDVRNLGETLGVSAVLEGSVRREGDRIRISAQLIDTNSGFHLWSESFDGAAKDGLVSETEVTGRIVEGIARSLGVQADRVEAHSRDAEARRLYWAARYLRQQATPEARDKARVLLEQAVGRDAKYSQAWGDLATLWLHATFHGEGKFEENLRHTRDAAKRAIELNARNTDGLVALAQVHWLQDRDWGAAERLLRQALESNPSSASAHGWLAMGLVAHAQFDGALRELERAAAISPISYAVSNDRAVALYCARRYRDAIREAKRTLQVNPKFVYARVVMGACYVAEHRYEEALRELRVAAAESRMPALGRLGNALARAGQQAEAEKIRGELGTADVHRAYVEIGLGDRVSAMKSLEHAFAEHETDLNYIAVDPVFDSLRVDPRFQVLVKKLGL